MSKKERNLVKGAIRRVFSRSDLRRAVIEASIVKYQDHNRPRVKTWCLCGICEKPTPKSYMEVDHIDPIIPIDSALEHMSWDTVIDRIWCEENNLQAICEECHDKKTSEERKQRAKARKEKKQ
jgi:5-methylcytosine-specific restriction endonuclease McrA